MKDDLVERMANTVAYGIDRGSTPRAIAENVLAIARPVILEEAAAWHEKNARHCREVATDDPRIGEDGRQKAKTAAAHHAASAATIRSLAHTTGQEG